MRWIEKMNATFFMVSTSSITMQSLRETVQRAPAVGAKIWCLSVLLPAGSMATCRYYIYCVSGQKSAFSPLQENYALDQKMVGPF